MKIQFNLNGHETEIDVHPLKRALDILRDDFHLYGSKEGCGEGECGACTVLMNGKTVTSCLIPAAQLHGKSVFTIEGIQDFAFFNDIQKAYEDAGAVQCGFCTTGFVMSTVGFLGNVEDFDKISDNEIKMALSGNLCRCTGYKKIIDAVRNLVKNKIQIPEKLIKNDLKKNTQISPQSHFIQPENLGQISNLISVNKNEKIKFLAGGTDMMVGEGRFSQDDLIISLDNVTELGRITKNERYLSIGSAVSFSDILANKFVQDNFPILVDAIQTIGSPQIRHRATIGGNLANASPAGDSIPPLMVLEAKILLNNAADDEIRKVNMNDFFIAPGKSILKNGEFIQSIEIPFPQSDNQIHYFRKVGQRKSLTISKTSLALICKLENDRIENIKIACGSVAPTVLRLKRTEKFLIGKKVDNEIIEEAKEILQSEISPIADIRSTAEYRREITANLLEDFFIKLV
ncbi:MAG: FAD binding domain-containing protein [Candidatus Cloacimonadota bacterium]|nr:FAD binding domain-containing protein [Candidatus Cloacimonadota bacterium]